MDEYAALAQRVVLTMDDVRGCLVLSRDGMILGAYPEEDEQSFKPAWLTFAHVGEARRGFVEFSDQMWAYVHRGPYAKLGAAHEALKQWCASNGRSIGTHSLEIYGDWCDDPDKLEALFHAYLRGTAMKLDLLDGKWDYWAVMERPVEELRVEYGIPD